MKNIKYFGWKENIKRDGHVVWRTNRYCNYACSYCWPGAHQNKKDFLDEDTYLIAIDHIIRQYKTNGFKNITWSWAGGEVTFNPHFLTILDEIQSYNDMFSMSTLVTNLSQSLKWWEKFVKCTKKFKKVRINGSWHKEYLVTDKQQELFKEKLVFLKNNGISSNASCVMLPGELQQMIELRDFFDLEEISVSIKPCRAGGLIIEGYSKEEINFFKQQVKHRQNGLVTIDFNNNKKWYTSAEQLQTEDINFLGWNCVAGFSSITINPDGTVTRGTVCKQEVLGNIKQGFTIFKNPTPCITDKYCNCNSDLLLPKWRRDGYNMSKMG